MMNTLMMILFIFSLALSNEAISMNELSQNLERILNEKGIILSSYKMDRLRENIWLLLGGNIKQKKRKGENDPVLIHSSWPYQYPAR